MTGPFPPPHRPFISQSVNATCVEHLNPEPNHSIASPKLLGHGTALQSHEQGANNQGRVSTISCASKDGNPNIAVPIRRGLHRHSQFPQRGLLCIRLCLSMTQWPFSRKYFARVPALFRKFL